MSEKYTQLHKQVVWDCWHEMTLTSNASIASVLTNRMHDDVIWHGPQPFDELQGVDTLLTGFWNPLLRAMPDLERETQMFLGGHFQHTDWITGTGYFSGNFMDDWLGIPPTGQSIRLRFGEFCRVENRKIVEIYLLLDMVDFMRQAGYDVLPAEQIISETVPALSHMTGRQLTPQNRVISQETFDLIYTMFQTLTKSDSSQQSGMMAYSSPLLKWYGPAGMGSTVTLEDYEKYVENPLRQAFPDQHMTAQDVIIGEGLLAASVGFPAIIGTHKGDFKGLPASGNSVQIRMMNWWIREGNRLVENRVMVDMIDLFMQCGVDLFERITA